MAWRLLPDGAASASRAGARRGAADLDRGQRLLLLAAAALVVRRMAGRGDHGATGLRVLGQGPPLRHPPQATTRRGGGAGQLLRLRRARTGAGPRTGALAAAGEP